MAGISFFHNQFGTENFSVPRAFENVNLILQCLHQFTCLAFCCLIVACALNIFSMWLLQILSLEWSSGVETLRCAGRVELTLVGSFADMILLPTAGATGINQNASLFVLTNPGQLHFYDDASLSALISQQERKSSLSAVEFPAAVPTSDPYMTVAKLSFLHTGGNSSKALSEVLNFCHGMTGPLMFPVSCI